MFLTGVDVIDRHGGLEPGLIYVIEAPGAGGREFIYSLLFRNGNANPSVITLTSTVEEVGREVVLTYPTFSEKLGEIRVESMADLYFRDSIVPLKWVVGGEELPLKRGESFLEKLVRVFDSIPDGSILFFDSVTDLVRMTGRGVEWPDVVDLMLGIRKLSIRKGILTLALVTSGVLGTKEENEILAGSDGIAVFEWVDERGGMSRWMHFRKLVGIMGYLEREKISRFRIRIDPQSGFSVTQYERVI